MPDVVYRVMESCEAYDFISPEIDGKVCKGHLQLQHPSNKRHWRALQRMGVKFVVCCRKLHPSSGLADLDFEVDLTNAKKSKGPQRRSG